MSEPTIDYETGEVTETELADDTEPTAETETLEHDDTLEQDDTDTETGERCEAETVVGGNEYRCALNEGHEGDHSFAVTEDEEDDPAPPPLLTDDDKAQAEALTRRAKSYTKSILDLLGADLGGWTACELCGPYHPGLHPPSEFVQIPADAQAALRTILGLPSLEGFKPDPFARGCDACEGKGRTLTGSHIEAYAHIRCIKCSGKGWLPVGDERRAAFAAEPAAPMPDAPAAPDDEYAPLPQETDDVDAWGTPKGDPMFGVAPQYRASRAGY